MADWEDAPSATTTSSPTSSVAWEDAPSAPKESFNEKYIQPVTDVVNRGLVGGLAGGPVDLANLGFQGIDYLSKKAGYPTHISSDKPIGGSEWFGEKMQDLGAVSSTRRPLAEAAVGFAPLAIGGGVGAVKAIGANGKVKELLDFATGKKVKEAYETLKSTAASEGLAGKSALEIQATGATQKEKDAIKRIGPDKGGHWKVV